MKNNIIIILLYIINFNSLIFASNMTISNKSVANAHQFSFRSIDNQIIKLSDFKDKIILIVNTASKCGFTPQYNDLQKLYEKYKDIGLIIIGVPSMDFANQEFSQISEIKEFTNKEFQITFVITEINKVKGKDAHPFYLWANKQAGFIGSPKWNFHKYLIDKNGNLDSWFSSMTNPLSEKITKRIEEL